MDDERGGELERITERIRTLVDEHFGRGEERFYLSGLGSLLQDDRRLLEKLTKTKLADFVEHKLEYELGRTGQHLNVLYIARPASAGPAAPTARTKYPRFIRELWNAFALPVEEGEHRYFDIVSKNVSSDPAALDENGTDVREIGDEFLSAEKVGAPTIAENIMKWLGQQNLDVALFIDRSQRASDAPSLLRQIMDRLDGDQLKRTVLPLDVVKALSERH